jgi:DNA-directed RNA polymerase specialized sigma24 family protein
VFYPEFHEKRMDLANRALESILLKMNTFEGREGAKFSTWAHKIIKNISIRAVRKMLRDRPFWQQFTEEVVPTK